jgi:hypothetical protein
LCVGSLRAGLALVVSTALATAAGVRVVTVGALQNEIPDRKARGSDLEGGQHRSNVSVRVLRYK